MSKKQNKKQLEDRAIEEMSDDSEGENEEGKRVEKKAPKCSTNLGDLLKKHMVGDDKE